MSNPLARCRFRLCFGKRGSLRWIGHLALRQSWERTFRRSRLPLAYSAGHHPQPKLLFASPLPLGFTSSGEVLDVWLEGNFSASLVQERLIAVCPPGLQLVSMRKLTDGELQVSKLVVASQYEAQLPEEGDCAALPMAIAELLDATELIRQRRGRTYDLRPLVEKLSLDPHARRIEMQLSCLPSHTGRPEEVLSQLTLDPAECRIHRRAQVLSEVLSESGVTAEPVALPSGSS